MITTKVTKSKRALGMLCGVLAAVCYGTNPLGALKLYAEGMIDSYTDEAGEKQQLDRKGQILSIIGDDRAWDYAVDFASKLRGEVNSFTDTTPVESQSLSDWMLERRRLR